MKFLFFCCSFWNRRWSHDCWKFFSRYVSYSNIVWFKLVIIILLFLVVHWKCNDISASIIYKNVTNIVHLIFSSLNDISMESSKQFNFSSTKISSFWSTIINWSIRMQRKLNLLLFLTFLPFLRWAWCSTSTATSLFLLFALFLCRLWSCFYLRKKSWIFSHIDEFWRVKPLLACSSASSFFH